MWVHVSIVSRQDIHIFEKHTEHGGDDWFLMIFYYAYIADGLGQSMQAARAASMSEWSLN